MILQDDKIMRHEIPNRMMSTTFTLPFDNSKVIGIVNYTAGAEGITPLAFWVKIKPTDSYIDRELRASGKLISRCLQHGEDLKELAETLSQDNIIGQMVNYFNKNVEEIISGLQPNKKQRMLSTDPYASQMKE